MSYAALRLYADMYFDFQEFRKSMENKVRSATVDGDFFVPIKDQLTGNEHVLSLSLCHELRRTAAPGIIAWQKSRDAVGIGEHLLGRLLGTIGDPLRAEPKHWEGTGSNRTLIDDEPHPRTVSQLWSYCGHGDPSRKRHRGMSWQDGAALGNPDAKSIVWNMAGFCVQSGVRYLCDDGEVSKRNGKDVCSRCGLHKDEHEQKSITHYGAVYLDRRVRTEDKNHVVECVRCGPSGRPAQPGTPWSKGHQHADGLRVLGKTILKDLWIAAGAISGSLTSAQSPPGGDPE